MQGADPPCDERRVPGRTPRRARRGGGGGERTTGIGEDLGFSYYVNKKGDVVISRHGKAVTTVRGHAAEKFQRSVARLDPQQAMARMTGNYRRGNEPRS